MEELLTPGDIAAVVGTCRDANFDADMLCYARDTCQQRHDRNRQNNCGNQVKDQGPHSVMATGVAQMARRADGVVHMVSRTVARLKARRQVLESTKVCIHRVHLQLLCPRAVRTMHRGCNVVCRDSALPG